MEFQILNLDDEYQCNECGVKFKKKGKKKPICPACKSKNVSGA